MSKFTIAFAKSVLSPLGMSLRKRDNEFRVNFRDGAEATAYYTDDLDDALSTGRAMALGRSETAAPAVPARG